MKAIDERTSVGGVKPRTVRTLLSADIRVKFPDLLLNAVDLMSRCIWQNERIRIHRVGDSIDHRSVSKWSIGRGHYLLIFFHNLYIVVEESKYALDDRSESRGSSNLRKADERFQGIRCNDGEWGVAVVDQIAAHRVRKPKSPAAPAVPFTAVSHQPLKMAFRAFQQTRVRIGAVEIQ